MTGLGRHRRRQIWERGTMARSMVLMRINQECGQWSGHSDWQQAPPFEQAARLVLLSDLTLTMLVESAIDWPIRAYRRHLKQDAKALASAMKDAGQVAQCWVFLAHAVVHYSKYSAVDEQVERDDRALALLDEHFPVAEDDDRGALELIQSATRLGYGGPLTAITFRAFELLLGERDRVEGMALFGGAESGRNHVAEIIRELGSIELAWNQALDNYVAAVEEGWDQNPEWNTD